VPVKTESLSRTVFEITGLRYWDHDLDLSRSRDVIDDVIIRSPIGHFLLVGNWYQASISNRFREYLHQNTRRCSERAYIHQVNILQLLYRLGVALPVSR